MTWTPEEDGILIAAHAEGRTDAEISTLLRDRTPQAVKRRRERLAEAGGVDLVRPAAIPVDRARLRELHAVGMSTPALAVALGATVRTVQQLLHEEGLKANRATADERRLRELHASGLSRRELGDALGVSQPTLRLWLGRAGLG